MDSLSRQRSKIGEGERSSAGMSAPIGKWVGGREERKTGASAKRVLRESQIFQASGRTVYQVSVYESIIAVTFYEYAKAMGISVEMNVKTKEGQKACPTSC